MQRKVTFTPRRFLKKIWQLGNFDVSPDGRLLAFAANKGDQWSVYLLDLRTKKDRILLQSEQSVLNPEFSPDGRWIAVQSDFEGDENYNIYLVPVRGAHVQKITDTPFDSAFPRWSPDGTKIAFLSNRDRDRDNVFVVDTGGGDAGNSRTWMTSSARLRGVRMVRASPSARAWASWITSASSTSPVTWRKSPHSRTRRARSGETSAGRDPGLRTVGSLRSSRTSTTTWTSACSMSSRRKSGSWSRAGGTRRCPSGPRTESGSRSWRTAMETSS